MFVILMENQNWSGIRGNPSAPYINGTLLPMASHAEQYYNPPGLHPSLPNYLWLEAGTDFGIYNDNPPSVNHQSTSNHLVTLLKAAGISWRAYEENISGTTCPLSDAYPYGVRHDPFVYFDDLTNTNTLNSPDCIAQVRPFSEFGGDLTNHTVARYNFITPNVCNDMHDSCPPLYNPVLQGDTWLSYNIPLILRSPAYTNGGAIFILWDEGVGGDGPIGMILLSPYAKGGGYSNTIHYTHGSTLRTLQKIFGVSPWLGDAVNAIDLSDLFRLGTIPNGDPFAPDGVADSSGYLQWTTNMYIWAAVNGRTLYVATWSPGNSGPNDHFIFVTDQLLPNASGPAPWAKAGQVAVSPSKPFIGGECQNGFVGWFNAPAGSRAIKWPDNTRQMEGTLDLVQAFGSMPATIYLAAAAYSTADSGPLVSQGPGGNGDGNLDPGEFLAVPIAAILDSNLNGVYDRVDAGLGFVISSIHGGNGGAVTFTWNSEPGRTYQVQYFGALDSPVTLQDLPGG